MKLLKSIGALALSVAVLASAVCMTASAEILEDGSVEGVRWFPVPENRQNDEAWEVECIADGCLCQRFTDEAETGNRSYLDTTYTAEGGLTLSRNDATIIMGDVDYTERYWPRIRTLSLETSPALDLKVADTLYFDVEVPEGSQWNISMAVNGIVISLARFMATECGIALPDGPDAGPGHYKGSLNIQETIEAIAADPSHLDNTNAMAFKNMKKTFVPQLQIYCVGPQTASLTVNELFISTADDTAGEKCTFVDMGLLSGFGDEYYELDIEEDEPADDPADDPADEPADDSAEESDTTTTTTPSVVEPVAQATGLWGWLTGIFNFLFGWLF